MSWAQCATCELVFTSDNEFDRHRIFVCTEHRPNQHGDECWDDRRCLTAVKMVETGWRQNGHGRWTHQPPRTAPSGEAYGPGRPDSAGLVTKAAS